MPASAGLALALPPDPAPAPAALLSATFDLDSSLGAIADAAGPWRSLFVEQLRVQADSATVHIQTISM
jgi:hypothetical protein